MTLRAKRFEFVGMVLILVSAGWQIFIERHVVNVAAQLREYKLDHKLDGLFAIVADTNRHEFAEKSDPKFHINATERIENWTLADFQVEGPMETLTKWAALISGIMFLCGSIFILYGKWLESIESPPQPNV